MQNREGIPKIEDEKNKDGMKFQWKCVNLIVKKYNTLTNMNVAIDLL